MNKKEKELIYKGGAKIPFRVLQSTAKRDLKVLRKKSKDINFKRDKDELKLLIQRLTTTMELESGIGIAAPQIGISRNVFLFIRVDKPDMPLEAVINPKIIAHAEETICFEMDGCLSVPETSGNSKRYPWIEVEYFNEKGERKKEKLIGYSRDDNFITVIFQHEFDHLEGVLFTDKLCELPN